MFYDQGLKFSCQMCRYCCSAEPGYVYLSREDIINGANATALSPRDFISVYCRVIDFGTFSMISLREKENYDCIFLSEKGCSIYPVRPKQCMNYPFWPSIMESEKAWKEESMHCPGIGQGELVSKEEIEKKLADASQPAEISKNP